MSKRTFGTAVVDTGKVTRDQLPRRLSDGPKAPFLIDLIHGTSWHRHSANRRHAPNLSME